MASGSNYTAEQLESIRKTLSSSLGDKSSQALESLQTRFTPAPDLTEDEAKLERMRATDEKKVDVDRMITLGRMSGMLKTLMEVKEDAGKQKKLVAAIIDHPDAKASDLVEALHGASNRRDLVEALVAAITAQKGVNPLIEAMRYAVISPNAINSLARSIAEQGTVNHLIRTIGTAPRNQPDAEVVLAMEIIRKGSIEQMIEALNLLDDASPGTVIIATGVVNRKEVGIEPLVRAMNNCKHNTKASGLIALEVTKRAEINALITLLERYISDDSDAGEILTAKLVNSSLPNYPKEGEDSLMLKACRHMHANSMAGKILVMGIMEQKDLAQMESAYLRLNGHPRAQQIMGLGLFKAANFLKATRLLGKEYFRMSKLQPELEAEIKRTKERFAHLITDILGEEVAKPGKPPPKTAKKKSEKKADKG